MITDCNSLFKVVIQQQATILNIYITAIVTLPTVIAPLILGPW